jgi:hypothetical protein
VIRLTDDGVEIDVPDDRPRGALRIESGEGWRARLVLDGRPIAWARAAPWRWEYAWAAPSPVPTLALVPPIRSSDARATDLDAWPRSFAERIVASERSWLAPGRWAVAAVPDDVARGLDRAVDVPPSFVERYGYAGSATVVPLRRPSAVDAARVKAWRKHARDGTLPPVLLGWVGLLDVYVILDGHDRLLAARLERIPPDAVAVLGVRDDVTTWTDDDRDRARADALARYDRIYAAEPRLQPRTRLDANARLVGAFTDYLQRRSWTPATFRPALADAFTRELADRDVPDDVRAVLFA